MLGRGDPVDLQIRFLEGEKAKVHLELATLHTSRGLAQEEERRAWERLDAVHADQTRIERKIGEGLEAIISIQHEIAELVPKPRSA